MSLNSDYISFLHDRESAENISFGIFLVKLKQGFIPISGEAEKDLKDFVAEICQHSYEMTQSWFDLWRKGAENLGMGIENFPDTQ